MKDVYYEGVETLMVYFIPAKCKGIPPSYKDKNKRQYAEDMCYLGQPFNKIVEYKDVSIIKKIKKPNEVLKKMIDDQNKLHQKLERNEKD